MVLRISFYIKPKDGETEVTDCTPGAFFPFRMFSRYDLKAGQNLVNIWNVDADYGAAPYRLNSDVERNL
jgi:hypothetical protein